MNKKISVLLLVLLTVMLTACSSQSLESYIEDNPEQLSNLETQASSQGFTVSFSADNNTLVLKSKLNDDLSVSIDDAKSELESVFSSMEESMTTIIEEIRKDVKDLSGIRMEYYTNNDELITSREFN